MDVDDQSLPGSGREIIAAPVHAAERLVGLGFRCSVAGAAFCDPASWRTLSGAYLTALGPECGNTLLLRLSQFTCAVHNTAQRPISVNQLGCRGFCRDECLAISVIAACQHDARPALRACASALTGSSDIGDTLNSAQIFAQELACAGQMLRADSVCPATCAFKLHPKRLS